MYGRELFMGRDSGEIHEGCEYLVGIVVPTHCKRIRGGALDPRRGAYYRSEKPPPGCRGQGEPERRRGQDRPGTGQLLPADQHRRRLEQGAFLPRPRRKASNAHVKYQTDSVYLKQTIYDFGRTSGAVDAARGNRDAAAETLAITRQDLAFRVQSRLLSVCWPPKSRLSPSGKPSRRGKRSYRQAQEFFNQGIRAKVDVARAEANLYAARTSLIRAKTTGRSHGSSLPTPWGFHPWETVPWRNHPLHRSLLPERSRAQQDALANRAELKRLKPCKAGGGRQPENRQERLSSDPVGNGERRLCGQGLSSRRQCLGGGPEPDDAAFFRLFHG